MRDPLPNVVGRIFQNTRGQSGAASEMGEVGADVSFRHALDHVAARARAARENFRAGSCHAIALRRAYWFCELGLVPRREIFCGIDEDSKAHFRMGEATELRAFAEIVSRRISGKCFVVGLAPPDIPLAAQ